MKVVAVDQGTTATKSFTLDSDGNFKTADSFEHRQIFPKPGWVEHDAEELLHHVQEAIAAAGPVDAIGIDNQGETVIAWDAKTGKPIHNAIVWQDDRTTSVTAKLKAEGAEELTLKRSGLPLDPYFSASKLRWYIDHADGAKQLLKTGKLRLSTTDAFFFASLTGVYATDVTTASRTSLMSLDTCAWDEELCKLFGVPMECLPEIRSTAGDFGMMGRTPVTAGLVDQQAALFGHGCARPGDAKITFGTGAFALALAGPARVDGGLFSILPTLAWKIGNSAPEFAFEGGVYNAASAVNWARSLGLFNEFAEIDGFKNSPAIERGLVFVPALSGLGCPHWDRSASGLWIGMGLDTTRRDMMQSLLEGVALRAGEVITAMAELLPLGNTISVDGGMARNAYLLQFLSNVLQKELRVPSSTELTALGTARMALRGAGISALPPLPPPRNIVKPRAEVSAEVKARFAEAIRRARNWKSD